MKILDVIHGVTQSWNKIKPIKLVRSWRKILPNVEGDFLDPIEPKTSEIVSEMRELMANLHGFENVDRENIEEWLEHDSNNAGFQIMGEAAIISNLIQPEEQETEDESGEEEITNRISHKTALSSVDTLLEQWEFEYNDIIALRKIRTDIKKIIKTFLKTNQNQRFS